MCMYVYIYIYIYANMYVYTCIIPCIGMCVYTYIYIYIYVPRGPHGPIKWDRGPIFKKNGCKNRTVP